MFTNVDTCSNVVEIKLDCGYQAKFDDLRAALGSLIYNISSLIEAMIKSVADLKKFLALCRPEIISKLQEIDDSFDSVMEIIRKETSIVNITLLKRIVKQYSSLSHLLVTESDPDIVSADFSHAVEANKLIAEYEKELNDFCKKESVKFLKNKS